MEGLSFDLDWEFDEEEDEEEAVCCEDARRAAAAAVRLECRGWVVAGGEECISRRSMSRFSICASAASKRAGGPRRGMNFAETMVLDDEHARMM